MEIFMRRSFVFTALAVSALAAAPALAQTGTEPAVPGTTPSVEAPAANMPSEPTQGTHHRKHMQSSNAEDQTPRRHRGSKSAQNAAEEEQTRNLNQQQLSAGATPQQMMPGQMAPAQPMQPGTMDQAPAMEQAPTMDQTMPSDESAPAE
ncbi:hypothetical protein [Inquilinus sp. CA228]|uniref:hypothetical protein n=1 Tax=Inquilinus sp. CA228 TaxID=3455609 RepID=UPI003F8D768A